MNKLFKVLAILALLALPSASLAGDYQKILAVQAEERQAAWGKNNFIIPDRPIIPPAPIVIIQQAPPVYIYNRTYIEVEVNVPEPQYYTPVYYPCGHRGRW